MKALRQEKIIEIIEKYDVETQDELAAYLEAAGFVATQATISRDIRQLKLMKVTGENGRAKYATLQGQDVDTLGKYNKVLSAGILSMEVAENIIVIKTVSGVAMAVAAALDNMSIEGLVGTIAGDDTIFCVAKSKELTKDIIANIKKVAY